MSILWPVVGQQDAYEPTTPWPSFKGFFWVQEPEHKQTRGMSRRRRSGSLASVERSRYRWGLLAGQSLESGKPEFSGRVPGEVGSQNREQDVLPNVHPRALAAAGQPRVEGGGMDARISTEAAVPY